MANTLGTGHFMTWDNCVCYK